MFNGAFTEVLLIGLAAMLVVAAVIDVRTFTISNRLNLTVAAARAALLAVDRAHRRGPTSRSSSPSAPACSSCSPAPSTPGMMGGGDVKLAAALALWFSPQSTIKFLVLMSLAGGVLTLGVLAWHRAKRREGRPEIPYGVAIAFGGLAISGNSRPTVS